MQNVGTCYQQFSEPTGPTQNMITNNIQYIMIQTKTAPKTHTKESPTKTHLASSLFGPFSAQKIHPCWCRPRCMHRMKEENEREGFLRPQGKNPGVKGWYPKINETYVRSISHIYIYNINISKNSAREVKYQEIWPWSCCDHLWQFEHAREHDKCKASKHHRTCRLPLPLRRFWLVLTESGRFVIQKIPKQTWHSLTCKTTSQS